MEKLLADVSENGAFHWEQWAETYQSVRRAAARLIGADASEIAFLKNTSEGLATVAGGIDWRAGDRVVTVETEFPANLYPWLALRERGVVVDLIPERDGRVDLEQIRRRCRGARVLAISYVQYLSGFRLDLEAVGSICRETGSLFVLDAIQGLGAFPLDVRRGGVHVLAADGHKWLTGPEGCAIFFVDQSVLPEIRPGEIGWMSVEHWADFRRATEIARKPAPIEWRAGAVRFECGTPNTVGMYGLGAAIEFLTSIGIETIARRVLEVRGQLLAILRAHDCEVLGDRTEMPERHRSGIVSFRPPNCEVSELFTRMGEAGVCCAARNGWLRCSPHFYNDNSDLERLAAVLASLAGRKAEG